MAIWKILSFLTLVSATSFAYPEFPSLRNQTVFPSDENSSSIRIKNERKHSENETIDPKSYKVCDTKECKIIAKEFLGSMNKSIDPCDNFYDFVCGGWTVNKIPGYMGTWNRMRLFHYTVKHRIKEILETKIEPSDLLPIRQAKKWYRSCMDTDARENRGIEPIESILIRGGGWPIAMDEEEWDSEGNSWQSVERHYARLTGEYTFYKIDVHPFSNVDEGTGSLVIDASTRPLPYLISVKYRNYSGNNYDAYIRFVSKIADFFVRHNNASVSKERSMKEAKEIVEFEKEIYELENNKNNSSQLERMTLEEFCDWYETNVTTNNTDPNAKIDWKSLIQELLDPMNIELNLTSKTWVHNRKYFEEIGKLLARTPKRTIVNYIHWKFVGNMLILTTEAMKEELFQFAKEEFGLKERPARWYGCVSAMAMTHVASYVFVDKYFTNHTKSAAREMIKNIQIAMEKQIENSNWLDTESKEWAKDKLNNMKILLGFPDWYENKTELINYYKGLTIGTEYFDNFLSYMRYKTRFNLRRNLPRMSNDPKWFIDPITVDARYSSTENYLTIPAVNLQAPLFTPKLPDNINYGIVGSAVGHEMGHAFDDTGIYYGKSRNASTLSEIALKNYYQRADCFLDKFDEYYGETGEAESKETTERSKQPKLKMSMRTRGENIADSIGIQSAFEAYQKLKKPETDGLRLPGFEKFTDDQMFFISFAASWCEIQNSDYAKWKNGTTDPHSPLKIRVLGSVSNTKDFAKAFNCPVGSPMNPSKKCSIWEKSSVTP